MTRFMPSGELSESVLTETTAAQPTVSVILPVYNVEDYVGECLDSIMRQKLSDFELVVVDDGSSDRSTQIAAEYAERDDRIQIVARPNGGLGAARNTGVRHAHGRYLTFVDSDDTLPAYALGRMVDAAEASGSELVVGSLRRFNSLERWRPSWDAELHATSRTGITIDELPALVRNNHAVAKLYRREFWKRHGFCFREGVAYEDQPLVAEAYVEAASIDVLPDSVYGYRSRDDRSALSQQTMSLRDLRDRIEAWKLSHRELRAAPHLHREWLSTLFADHFHPYLRSPAVNSDQYWRELHTAIVELTDAAPEAIWESIEPDQRVAIELARQGRRNDLLDFYQRDGVRETAYPAEPRPGGALYRLPYVDDPTMPTELFTVPADRLVLEHEIHGFSWLNQTTAQLRGWAFIRQIDLANHPTHTRVVVRDEESGREHVFDAEPDDAPGYPPPVEHERIDYRAGAFRCTLDLDEVVRASAGGVRRWSVHLQTTTGDVTLEIPIRRLIRSSSAGVIAAGIHADGHRVVADWKLGEPLVLEVRPFRLAATDVAMEWRELSGTLTGPDADAVVAVEFEGDAASRTPVVTDDEGRSTFALKLSRNDVTGLAPGEFVAWRVRAELHSGEWAYLTYDGAQQLEVVHSHGGRVTAIERTRAGLLAVCEWRVVALADEAWVDSRDVLRIRGRLHGARGDQTRMRVRLRSRKTMVASQPIDHTRGEFEISVPLEYRAGRFGSRPLPVAAHDVVCQLLDADGNAERVPLHLTQELGSRLPIAVRTDRLDGRIVRGPENKMRVHLGRPVFDARGAYRQRQLRATLGTTSGDGLRNVLLCRSYFGESASCNGVGVLRELRRRGADTEVYWGVTDYSVPVPEGARPVAVNSAEWYDLLRSARYYLDNMFQPDYYRKPPGQVLIQTFHGYPFKTMGYAHWASTGVSPHRVESYERRVAQWDYLLSPASYATPLLCRDFGFSGDVLEIGYPRNDVLLADDAETIRTQVRQSLGIAADQKVVLYAPTFRDYESPDDHRAALADVLDIEEVRRGLQPDGVLLVRGHAFNARAGERAPQRPGLIDVTDYPEAADLYLAADAAIVDYSSLRFDFAVTGKPMVFHVPDLARYRSSRGWVVDFTSTAPGPLVATTEAVLDWLGDLDELRAAYARQYDQFRANFIEQEDGRAGARFVDQVMVPRGDAPRG